MDVDKRTEGHMRCQSGPCYWCIQPAQRSWGQHRSFLQTIPAAPFSGPTFTRVALLPIPKEELPWLTLELRMKQTTVCALKAFIMSGGTPGWRSQMGVSRGRCQSSQAPPCPWCYSSHEEAGVPLSCPWQQECKRSPLPYKKKSEIITLDARMCKRSPNGSWTLSFPQAIQWCQTQGWHALNPLGEGGTPSAGPDQYLLFSHNTHQ